VRESEKERFWILWEKANQNHLIRLLDPDQVHIPKTRGMFDFMQRSTD